MKPSSIIGSVIAPVITIILFPIATNHVISGNGHVLTADKEKLGDCELSIEIKEVSARVFYYSKRFLFVFDGSTF